VTLRLDELETLPDTCLGLDPDHVRLLAAEIAAGQTLACLTVAVMTEADGKAHYYIIDGYHRLAAAKEAGLTEVMADVYLGLSFGEMARKAMALNLFRLKARPLGILLAVRRYPPRMRAVAIADELHVDPGYVWQAQKVIRYCPPAMFRLFVADPGTYTWQTVREVANRIARRKQPVSNENAETILNEMMGVIAKAAAAVAAKKVAAKEAARQSAPASAVTADAADDAKDADEGEAPAAPTSTTSPTPTPAPLTIVKTSQPRLADAWCKALAKAGVEPASITVMVAHLAKLIEVASSAGVTRRDQETAVRVLFKS